MVDGRHDLGVLKVGIPKLEHAELLSCTAVIRCSFAFHTANFMCSCKSLQPIIIMLHEEMRNNLAIRHSSYTWRHDLSNNVLHDVMAHYLHRCIHVFAFGIHFNNQVFHLILSSLNPNLVWGWLSCYTQTIFVHTYQHIKWWWSILLRYRNMRQTINWHLFCICYKFTVRKQL